MKPWSGLAAMMLLLAMIFYVVALSSSQWLVASSAGQQRYQGPFEYCADIWSDNIHECRRVDNSCVAMMSAPLGAVTAGDNCHYIRTTRAFLVLGLIFSSIAFVLAWLGYNSYVDDLMYRIPAMLFSAIAFCCGLIAWAVYTAMAQRGFPDWGYSWAYGLALGAWLINGAAIVTMMVPAPARDLKTGEILARRTARGERGSWWDMFTARWWTEGARWGEAGLGPGAVPGAVPPRAREAEYEKRGVPPGTAYREGPPPESYRYREERGGYPEERERGREREREREWLGRKEEPISPREREKRAAYEREYGPTRHEEPATRWLGPSTAPGTTTSLAPATTTATHTRESSAGKV